jgi:WD40 repeat protein/serine/threonine protein kinase
MLGGRYRLRERLGAGGVGVVYLAEDTQLHRAVAIKLPRTPLPEDSVERARFFREANAAAGLHHPQIVALYDAGEMDGVCYLASAYCPGDTLAKWIVQQPPHDKRAAAAPIVLALAEAIQHAHENGVLHRDIKPQNILLDPTVRHRDLPFTPKLTDFSIAKLIDSDGTQTATEVMLGTPRYMAPELAAGRRDQLGPACDIYSLGVVLYELLTGRPPIEGASHADTLRRVLSDDPVRPCRIASDIPRDLEAICLTCLEKNPDKRYATAAALAQDLERFMAHQPTAARPIGRIHQIARWLRRRPAIAALVAVSSLASASLLFGLLFHNHRLGTLNLQLNRTNTELESAVNDAEHARSRAEQSEAQTAELLYVSDMRLSARAWKEGDMRGLTALLHRHIPRGEQPDRRGLEWRFLRNIAEAKPQPIDSLSTSIYDMRVSSNGRWLAAAGRDALVRIYDFETSTLERTIETGQREVNGVSFSPDGTRLASTGDDGSLRVWDRSNGTELLRIAAHPNLAYQVHYTPDGTKLVTCGKDSVGRVWNAATGELIGSFTGHTGEIEAIAVSPDGLLVATASRDNSFRIWNLADQSQVQAFEDKWSGNIFSSVDFSADSKWVVAGDYNKQVWICTTQPGRYHGIGRHLDRVYSVAVSENGRYIASGDSAGTIFLWDLEQAAGSILSGRPDASNLRCARMWKAHDSRISSLAFEPFGNRLYSAGTDGDVHAWHITDAPGPDRFIRSLGTVESFAFLRDNRMLALKQHVGVFGWRAGSSPTDEPKLVQSCPGVVMSSNDAGTLVAIDNGRFEVELWQLPGGLAGKWQMYESTTGPKFCLSPDGKLLAVLVPGSDRSIQVYETGSRSLSREFQVPEGAARVEGFSPNGAQLAVTINNDLLLFDMHGNPLVRINGVHSNVIALAYSRDGTVLATGGSDRLIKLWDPLTGKLLTTLFGHRGDITSLVFAPDGRSLFVADQEGTLKVWNVAAGEELFDLYHHEGEGLRQVQVSNDGRWLACTTSQDNGVLLLDLGEER